jgi:hypothetical protein
VSGQHSLPMPSTRYGPSGCSSSAVKTEPSGSTATIRALDPCSLAAVRLLPELRPRRRVVRLGVRGIGVLVRLESAGNLLGEPVGDRVVALRRVRVDGRRGDDDLGAVRPEHRDLLLAHLVRHDEDAAVAAERRRHGEADAGVPRGRLDDGPARPEPAVALGGLDHREPDPVLHGPARVQVFELREELARHLATEPREPDDRRLADELEDGRILAARHRALSLLRALASTGAGRKLRLDRGREREPLANTWVELLRLFSPSAAWAYVSALWHSRSVATTDAHTWRLRRPPSRDC